MSIRLSLCWDIASTAAGGRRDSAAAETILAVACEAGDHMREQTEDRLFERSVGHYQAVVVRINPSAGPEYGVAEMEGNIDLPRGGHAAGPRVRPERQNTYVQRAQDADV